MEDIMVRKFFLAAAVSCGGLALCISPASARPSPSDTCGHDRVALGFVVHLGMGSAGDGARAPVVGEADNQCDVLGAGSAEAILDEGASFHAPSDRQLQSAASELKQILDMENGVVAADAPQKQQVEGKE
jgi:hypothetical protein